MSREAWIDGRFAPAGPAAGDDEGLFETIGSFAGRLPLWERHLDRLRCGAARIGLECAPPRELHEAALALLARNGDDVVRVTLSPGHAGRRWTLTTRSRDREPGPVAVVLASEARAPHERDDLKVTSRVRLDAWRAAARARGAHDALLWRDGRLLEATSYNVFVHEAGRWRTPPADGAILPGVARAILLAAGCAVEEPVPLAALPGRPLVLSNAVYGVRAAFLAGGEPPAEVPGLDDLRAALAAALRS